MNTPEWQVEVVMLDVALATELLRSEEGNRTRKPTRSKRYERDRNDGLWMEDAPTLIVVDRDGRLIDGGHRCDMVISTGKPIPVILVRNVNPEARKVIDAGAVRSLRDQIHMSWGDEVKDPGILGAAMRGLYQEQEGISVGERWTPGVPALMELTERKREQVQPFTNEARRINDVVNFGSPGVLCAQMYLMHEADSERASRFYDRLETGLHLVSNRDQIAQLRKMLLNPKRKDSGSRRGVDPVFNGALLRKAFNNWRQDSQKVLVYDPKREKYPPIYTWPEIERAG